MEHVPENFQKIYGIDVNAEYLSVCSKRFQPVLKERLELIELDLTRQSVVLPVVELIVADLVVEYLGPEVFSSKIADAQARYVTCVIQSPGEAESFVSQSPYEKAFRQIGLLHHDVDTEELSDKMNACGYVESCRSITKLPNRKELLRLDYEKLPEK